MCIGKKKQVGVSLQVSVRKTLITFQLTFCQWELWQNGEALDYYSEEHNIKKLR